MAKLIECGLKIERGLKRRLTGKEGEGYGEEGGLEVNHHLSKGFRKFTNLRWILNRGAISGQPEGRTDWITGWVKV